jgi:hypothetical protein
VPQVTRWNLLVPQPSLKDEFDLAAVAGADRRQPVVLDEPRHRRLGHTEDPGHLSEAQKLVGHREIVEVAPVDNSPEPSWRGP